MKLRSVFVAVVAGIAAVPAGARADEPAQADAPLAPVAASPAEPTPEPGALAPKKTKDAVHKHRDFEWDPRWPKVQTYEYVLTGAYAATAVVGALAIPGSPRWTKTDAFDDAVRNKLRITNPDDAQIARDASDVGLTVLVNQAVIDDLFVAWWARQHPVVAWQLAVMDAETLAFTTSVNTVLTGLIGRQRPYVASTCTQANLQDTANCNGSNRYRSFFSGHTTAAFTLAGLTCIHHAELPLYGGGAPDALACAGAMATATTVGFMRVLSDQHYMTDVIVGAAFGATAGVGMPWLLHYRGGAKLESEHGKPKAGDAPPPMLIATPTGVQLLGAF